MELKSTLPQPMIKPYILWNVQRWSCVCSTTSQWFCPGVHKWKHCYFAIYGDIGKALQIPKEDKPLFTCLGLADDFNGIDVEQAQEYIRISCSNCIDWIMTSRGWSTEKSMQPTSQPLSPLPADCLSQLSKHKGPPEGSSEHLKLQQKSGVSYRTLLGEMFHVELILDTRYHPHVQVFFQAFCVSLQMFKRHCKIPSHNLTLGYQIQTVQTKTWSQARNYWIYSPLLPSSSLSGEYY